MKHPTKHPWQRIKHVFAFRKWEDENGAEAGRIKTRHAVETLSSAANHNSKTVTAELASTGFSAGSRRRVAALG